jgi:hypothetical protein
MPQEDQMQLKGFVDALEKIGKTRPADKPWGVFKIVRHATPVTGLW